MESIAFVRQFQDLRRRLFGVLLLVVVSSRIIAFLSYGFVRTGGALAVAAISLVIGFWLSARWAYKVYRCPACQKIPMKVEVREWTKYTRYLHWLQVSKRFKIYPPWAVFFIDFNPARCPGCGTALGKRGEEFAGAT